ncbi:cell wall protein IFF6-like [Drosophila santomea]|uniref:cell wall protein IFF6-like n=1 Tax=Drosophila santomea TaxID=129105 RepID=UPI001953AB37|nr:cell wall protein IFF6-like [Drosophila santomea]
MHERSIHYFHNIQPKMFRAQRVCLYFVAFLVLAAARPKISQQISQNQIGLRVIDLSTEESVPSKSSLATEAASEPSTESSSEELPTVTSSSEETSEAPESSSQETAESSEDSSEDESSESSDESDEGSYYYDYYSYYDY